MCGQMLVDAAGDELVGDWKKLEQHKLQRKDSGVIMVLC